MNLFLYFVSISGLSMMSFLLTLLLAAILHY